MSFGLESVYIGEHNITYLLNSSHDHMLHRFFQGHYSLNMFYDLKKNQIWKNNLLFIHSTLAIQLTV